jgi:hypothetical protein
MLTQLPPAREATLVEIRDFFGMGSREIKDNWTPLNDAEKTYFKTAVAAENDRPKI